ncbi:MAG: sigma-70 family RNA polymerase sigma factor [Clostridia bacterium]|nr:sigma-70 family RNA polymerase sigma factor [Clostridia bacterium]
MKNIDEIYSEYANLIKNYIFSITRDKELSEEIMQETFVVAINQIDNFRGECKISVWLCSIAKKILYKETKKHNLRNIIPIDELEITDNKSIEEECIKNDNKLRLYEALQNLDVITREVMYLRLTGDLTFKEIGKILNKSENWARVTFFRGKQKLSKEDII